jgi:hypothetical protein
MRVAANRIADIVVPLLLTLNVSLTNVMIIVAPRLSASFRAAQPVTDLIHFLPTDRSCPMGAAHGGRVRPRTCPIRDGRLLLTTAGLTGRDTSANQLATSRADIPRRCTPTHHGRRASGMPTQPKAV